MLSQPGDHLCSDTGAHEGHLTLKPFQHIDFLQAGPETITWLQAESSIYADHTGKRLNVASQCFIENSLLVLLTISFLSWQRRRSAIYCWHSSHGTQPPENPRDSLSALFPVLMAVIFLHLQTGELRPKGDAQGHLVTEGDSWAGSPGFSDAHARGKENAVTTEQKRTTLLVEYSNSGDSEVTLKGSGVVDTPCRACPSALALSLRTLFRSASRLCYWQQLQLRSRFIYLKPTQT